MCANLTIYLLSMFAHIFAHFQKFTKCGLNMCIYMLHVKSPPFVNIQTLIFATRQEFFNFGANCFLKKSRNKRAKYFSDFSKSLVFQT